MHRQGYLEQLDYEAAQPCLEQQPFQWQETSSHDATAGPLLL